MTRVMLVASITLPSGDVPLFVQRGLRQIGCETRLLAIDEDLPLIETVRYRNPHTFDRRRFNRRLTRVATAYQPEVLFVYGSNWGIYPATLARLKARLGCKAILYWRAFQVEALRQYDHLFSLDSYPVPLLRLPSTGLADVHVLGPACDPEEHARVELTPSDEQRFAAQVTFIGGGRSRRRALFEHLTDYDLKLWGWGWNKSPKLDRHFVPETVSGLKKTKIYSATPICPNLQSGHYQVNGVTCRVFEVACCGRAPFSEAQPDLERFFDPGDEVIVFENADDLKQKVAYFLAHHDELERIAERARQRAVSEHTYRHRMQQLMEIVLD
jgi:spore maturation protein CgeB